MKVLFNMNYKKIYYDFICDRRSKCDPDGYFEKHHIVPKCLGGWDDLGNIINLSFEDHIRAHILLAKIHGGRLWSPVSFIISNRGNKRIPTKREIKLHVFAKTMQAKYTKGGNSPSADKTIYKFIHVSGDIYTGTRADFCIDNDVKRGTVHNLFSGKRYFVYNWGLLHKTSLQQLRRAIVDRQEAIILKNSKGKFNKLKLPGRKPKRRVLLENGSYGFKKETTLKSYDWVNRLGDIEKGSQYYMCEKYKGSPSGWSYAAKGERVCKGWVNKMFDFPTKPMNKSSCMLYNTDGRVVKGKVSELRKLTGLSDKQISMLKSGGSSVTKTGWYFDKVVLDAYRVEINKRGKQAGARISGWNRKAVICLDNDKVYDSSEVAAKVVGVSSGRNIRSVCDGKRNSVAGLRWAYV